MDEGRQIDKITVEHSFDQLEYAYLIVSDEEYDLRKSSGNELTASLPHGMIQTGEKVVVVALCDGEVIQETLHWMD